MVVYVAAKEASPRQRPSGHGCATSREQDAAPLLAARPHRVGSLPIVPGEQIADRSAHEIGDAALSEVMLSIVDHVASLAESGEIGSRVIGDVVVQVSAGDHDFRPAVAEINRQVRWGGQIGANALAPSITPLAAFLVEPAPVGQNTDGLAVWASAVLACPFGAAEADRMGKLAPVDRIETP